MNYTVLLTRSFDLYLVKFPYPLNFSKRNNRNGPVHVHGSITKYITTFIVHFALNVNVLLVVTFDQVTQYYLNCTHACITI